jgi:hypothetical protein
MLSPLEEGLLIGLEYGRSMIVCGQRMTVCGQRTRDCKSIWKLHGEGESFEH